MMKPTKIAYAAGGWLLMVTVALGGCGETADRSLAVIDSAGVEIVTNSPGSIEAAETWSLSAEPVVEIGAGANPDVALYEITDVAPLAGGRVAVGTLTPSRALVFEPDGTLAATLGGEGEGPGEFSMVRSVAPLGGDSVAVWDPSRRRISVFAADGALVREVDLSDVAPLSAMAVPNTRMTSGFVHLLPGGSGSLVLFGEGLFGSNDDPGVGRPELPTRRITTQGDELASLGPFPGMEVVFGSQLELRPFGARTYATTVGDALVVGTAETTQYRVFGPGGELERIVRWPDGDRDVGGPFLSTWSDMVDSAPPRMREMVEALPLPERFPPYEGLVSTDAGEVLVGEYAGPVGIVPMRRADHGPEALRPQRPIPERRWLVFGPDGALTAQVSTAEGFEPYAVRQGRMWGVYTDEVDVESIRAYRLSRG